MNTESKTKKVLKNIAKGALAVVAPPIGFPTFFKKDKISGFALGLVLATGSNTGYILSQNKTVYDSPEIITKFTPISRAWVPLALLTPFASKYSTQVTTLTEDDPYTNDEKANKTFEVQGYDVIVFDKEQGQYFLNFEQDRKFRTSEGKLVSLMEAQAQIDALTLEQQRLVAEGNILKAKELTVEIANAKSYKTSVSKQYEEVRAAYSGAISKMNSDLEFLSKNTGEQK